jgi:phosphoglycerate dehydrogenase-like enzyme
VAQQKTPRIVLAMRRDLPAHLFDDHARDRLGQVGMVDLSVCLTEFDSPTARRHLADAEVLLTGWGCPRVSSQILDLAPCLRAVVHAAGTVKEHLDHACWERGIVVSTAAEANAVPVAEFTLAMVLLAGKWAHQGARRYEERRTLPDLITEFPEVGNYRRSIGVVGASRIGRRVMALLRAFDLDVLVSDPYLDAREATVLGAELVELDDLVRRSDIVSLHAPSIASTYRMFDARRLALMKDGATLLNTARGALVDPDALVDELASGRIQAVLDVTDPEPLSPSSPLFSLPNVVLTPHLAGAAGNELFRLGDWAVEEIARWAAGEPFLSPVRLSDLATMA